MSAAQAILILLDEVRGKTLQILDATRDEWMLWAPPGTQNHIAWHSGHVLWIADVLLIKPATGAAALPAEWEQTFGMNTTPAQTLQWPSRAELISRLRDQHSRLRALIAKLTDDELARPPKAF